MGKEHWRECWLAPEQFTGLQKWQQCEDFREVVKIESGKMGIKCPRDKTRSLQCENRLSSRVLHNMQKENYFFHQVVLYDS